jgi:hypothetical protein
MRLHRPGSRTLADVNAVVSALLVFSAAVLVAMLELDESYAAESTLVESLPDLLMTLSFVVVGAFVTVKRPDNLVGWALSLSSVGLLAGGVLSVYSELALLAKPEANLPGGGVAGALSPGSWTPLVSGVFLLFLVFPGGRVPPRWRRVVPLVLAGYAFVWFAIATTPGELEPPVDAFENPLAFTSSDAWVVAIYPIIAVCQTCLVLSAISLILRFRRSRGDERQQFKWLAASAGFLALALPFATAFNFTAAAGFVMTVALILLPVSVGIAILRYRLYDIDRVISRTLVYGALTVILGAAYVGLVLAGQAVFSSFAGGSNLSIAVSTLVVAALFLPARSRVQRFVDRRFYRRRYDAQRTLDAFGARLRREVDLESLSGDLQTVVRETMQPQHASLWLRREPARGER